jgi:hypothetical protein
MLCMTACCTGFVQERDNVDGIQKVADAMLCRAVRTVLYRFVVDGYHGGHTYLRRTFRGMATETWLRRRETGSDPVDPLRTGAYGQGIRCYEHSAGARCQPSGTGRGNGYFS